MGQRSCSQRMESVVLTKDGECRGAAGGGRDRMDRPGAGSFWISGTFHESHALCSSIEDAALYSKHKYHLSKRIKSGGGKAVSSPSTPSTSAFARGVSAPPPMRHRRQT
mmetsp:Transcript_7175/g.10929  ORF Transcript_7175/g.10929 Transcript_7175/m.10929 type:complete len:109 (-) Transcript_7175:25-351(-)